VDSLGKNAAELYRALACSGGRQAVAKIFAMRDDVLRAIRTRRFFLA
jgi:hypothetical protein